MASHTMSPPTTLPKALHPQAAHLTQSVHAYLERTYSFSSPETKHAFLLMDFPRLVASLAPSGRIERLESAALFVSLTGILDDAFSQMSISDSREIGAKLLGIMQGGAPADVLNPLEKILGKIVEDMNAQNPLLAKDVLDGAVTLFLAQTDKARLDITQLDEYFEFRFRDVGGEYVSNSLICGIGAKKLTDYGGRFFTALVRFVNDIVLSRSERAKFNSLEKTTIRHVIIANDILSWEKELKEATESNEEGAALCSVVPILARNLGIGFDGAKRVLWAAARELEEEMEGLVDSGALSNDGKRYVQALKYLASGNEEWCRTTSRYRVE
ncbi:isoprenoid synthase domain-containing protein [Aspergillus spinulosporus]